MDVGPSLKLVVAGVPRSVIWRVGRAMLGRVGAAVPEPPPPGELRKVKIVSTGAAICGTEVRMTMANDEVPEPPRHCMDEMDLVATPRGVTALSGRVHSPGECTGLWRVTPWVRSAAPCGGRSSATGWR